MFLTILLFCACHKKESSPPFGSAQGPAETITTVQKCQQLNWEYSAADGSQHYRWQYYYTGNRLDSCAMFGAQRITTIYQYASATQRKVLQKNYTSGIDPGPYTIENIDGHGNIIESIGYDKNGKLISSSHGDWKCD